MTDLEQWDLTDIYADDALWEQDLDRVKELLQAISELKGTLQDVSYLKDVLLIQTALSALLEKVYGYAHMRYDLDHTDSKAQAMRDKALSAYYNAAEVTAFILPEITALPKECIPMALEKYSELQEYRHMLEDIERHRPFVLSQREEQLLSMAAPALSAMDTAFSMLESADLDKGTIVNEEGETVTLTDGIFAQCRESQDRRVREEAFSSLHSAFAKMGNTIASLYAGQVRADVFYAKAKGYDSSLHQALFEDRLPSSLYSGLIETVHRFLPIHYQYLELRRKALGVEKLHLYDCYVPLVENNTETYSYTQAKNLVTKYLEPLGDQYLDDLAQLLKGGWVDVYEKKGKATGAYATGIYGVHPYMLLNFMGQMNDVFTLAHEAGHCMHTYYSDTQSFVNKEYPIFLAEIASTVNENLLLRGMLKDAKDDETKAYLINHYIDEFRGTVIRQTMFAEFEWKVHQLAEKGEPLTADVFCKIYHELLTLYFGPDVIIDSYMDWEWARIPHFYRAFYVFKYATGFSAASAISKNILENKEIKPYLDFLHAGGSDYPLEILKKAGVDLSETGPIMVALQEFEQMVKEFKSLYISEV